MYEFNSNTGIIESPNYPNDYDINDYCQWYINPTNGIPGGQVRLPRGKVNDIKNNQYNGHIEI